MRLGAADRIGADQALGADRGHRKRKTGRQRSRNRPSTVEAGRELPKPSELFQAGARPWPIRQRRTTSRTGDSGGQANSA